MILSDFNDNIQNTNQSFSSEVLKMNPLKWGLILIFSIIVFIFYSLGVLKQPAFFIEYLALDTKVAVLQMYQKFETYTTGINNVPALAEENQQLQQKIIKLESKLAQVDTIFEENKELINQIEIKYSRDYKIQGAMVIDYPEGQLGFLKINKGKKDNINIGDQVVKENILVGEIIEVFEYSSLVRLINNAKTSFPVKNAQEQIGILKGNGTNSIEINSILQTTEIKKGDKIYSSGNFPDLYIGEITKIDDDPRANTKKAELTHPLDLQKLQRLVVLQNN